MMWVAGARTAITKEEVRCEGRRRKWREEKNCGDDVAKVAGSHPPAFIYSFTDAPSNIQPHYHHEQ
jgi:hypothetical protein